MLVAGIDMSLGPHLAHTVKMVDVDVDKHPKQARQNLLSHLHEGLREGSTNICGEDVLIVDLYLNPVHEQAHVFGSRQRCWLLVLVLILPAVFILGPTGHDGAGLISAGVTDGAVDEVDAVEEIDYVDGHPVVEVLAMGQLHGLLQVQPCIQRRLCLLVQVEALRPGLELALGPECPVFVEDLFQGHGHGWMWWHGAICLNALGGLITVEMEAVNQSSFFYICLDTLCYFVPPSCSASFLRSFFIENCLVTDR